MALGITPGERVYCSFNSMQREMFRSEKPNRVRMRARLDLPPHDEMRLSETNF